MTKQQDKGGQLVPRSEPNESILDIAAILTSAVPWIGGPISAVLSGQSFGRKIDRVGEVLEQLAHDLKDFQSTASEKYVKTEEFEELLERTLRQIADERSEEKRRIYGAFLVDAVKSPGEPYDEQLRFLRTLEELQADHLRVLKAYSTPPEGGDGFAGSPGQTLSTRLPGISRDRIMDLASQLNDMRLTNIASLNTMMTFHGAQDLRHAVTPYGARFLGYLVASQR